MRSRKTDLTLALAACAHESGRRNARQPQQNGNSLAVPGRTPVTGTATTAAGRPAKGEKLDGKQIFARCSPAVFMVYTTDGQRLFQGSGFFIGENGLAVSNYHVFEGTGIGMESIRISGSDTRYHVSEIIARSQEPDYILFRVNCTGNSYIPLAAERPSPGERVFAIGSPKGLENTFSEGVVSAWRTDDLMQISVPIDHGSSGGALINEYGEAVGITSGTLDGDSQANLNYAWSTKDLKQSTGSGNQ